MASRAELQHLVEQVPEEQLDAAVQALQALLDAAPDTAPVDRDEEDKRRRQERPGGNEAA